MSKLKEKSKVTSREITNNYVLPLWRDMALEVVDVYFTPQANNLSFLRMARVQNLR